MLRLLARAAGRRGSSGGGSPCDAAPVSRAHSPPGLAGGVGAALGQDPQSWLPPRKEGLPGARPDSRVHWGAQQAAAPPEAWGTAPRGCMWERLQGRRLEPGTTRTRPVTSHGSVGVTGRDAWPCSADTGPSP